MVESHAYWNGGTNCQSLGDQSSRAQAMESRVKKYHSAFDGSYLWGGKSYPTFKASKGTGQE